MFVCTCTIMNIPGEVLDRMNVIRMPGYTEIEKLNIANRYLIPKQMKANGLKKSEIEIKEEAILDTIRYYTREAGVRGLEREIAKLCRKVVTNHGKSKKAELETIDSNPSAEHLGVRKFRL